MTSSFEFNCDDIVRFMSHVEFLSFGCWYWTGSRSRGKGNRKWYPTFALASKKRVRGHRFSCEAIGKQPPLPHGWHRDHLCNFSMCVNPAHVEYVTHAENQRRKLERRMEHEYLSKEGLPPMLGLNHYDPDGDRGLCALARPSSRPTTPDGGTS